MIEALAKATMVIILQYISVSNQHIEHFKVVSLCSNIS